MWLAIKKIGLKILYSSQEEQHPYRIYALFQLISNPIYYLLWVYVDKQGYENIGVRSLISLMCLPLLFHEYWTATNKKLLSIYWYIVCFYSLPFFFTFMLFKNNFCYGWSLNSLTGIILCILFLDTKPLMILVPLGAVTGWLAYFLTTSDPYYDIAAMKTILITYGSAFLFGVLFFQRARYRERIGAMKLFAGSIAHKLRTPLACIRMSAEVLDDYADAYHSAYLKAREAKLEVPSIPERHLKKLPQLPKNIQNFSNNSQIIIDMLLMKLNEGTDTPLQVCSMKDCVLLALDSYPFELGQRQKIHWKDDTDFSFLGQDNFMKHVLYNLIKNGLYAIARAGKGEIFIEIKTNVLVKGQAMSQLIFKDTGPGIEEKHLRHIFDRFYSKSRNGTGIGLAFCESVIQSFGGSIGCASTLGEETIFTICLPQVQQLSEN